MTLKKNNAREEEERRRKSTKKKEEEESLTFALKNKFLHSQINQAYHFDSSFAILNQIKRSILAGLHSFSVRSEHGTAIGAWLSRTGGPPQRAIRSKLHWARPWFYLWRQVSILLRHLSPSYRGTKMASFFSPVYICCGGFFYKLLCFCVFWVCILSVCVFASERKSCRLVGSGRCMNGFTTPSLLNAMSSSLFSPGFSFTKSVLHIKLWVHAARLRVICQ